MAKSWLQKHGTYEEEIFSSVTGIVANAAGGQAAATQITAKFNSIDTVAVANASVKLPAAKIGKKCFLLNTVATPAFLCAVFPQSGEYIDGFLNGIDIGGISYVSRIPGASMRAYECYEDGKWTTVNNPKVLMLETRVTVSQAQIQTSFTTPVALLLQHGSYIIDPVSIYRTSTNGGYSGNTTGAITSDFAKVEQEHTSFDYDQLFNGLKKCVENTNGAYLKNQEGLYFYTKTGNPTGAGGAITFYILYRLTLV